jgi:hypothetical protein
MSGIDRTLVGACGIWCGSCDVFIACHEGDREKQEEIAEMISLQFGAEVNPAEIVCEGCRGPIEVHFCVACKIRPCADGRKCATCGECDEMDTCELLLAFHRTEIGRPARVNLKEIRRSDLNKWIKRKKAGE